MTGIQGKIAIVFRVLIGLALFGGGMAKLFGVQHMVDEFATVGAKIGTGQWLRYATGLVEVAGALCLIRARTVTIGAGLLIAVTVAAFYAQVTILHQDWHHPIVLAAILGWIGYGFRGAMKPK